MDSKKKKKSPQYFPKKDKEKDMGKTIYIGNLNYKRDEEGVKYLFSKFGKVKSVEIMEDPETEKKLGYAFVKMYKSNEALLAIKGLNGKIVDGRTLKVSEAKDRFDTPQKVFSKPKIKEEVKPKVPQKRKRKNSGLQKLFNYLNPKTPKKPSK